MSITLLTRSEASDLSGASATSVKKAIDQRVIATPRRGVQSLVEADDVPVLTMLWLLTDLRLSLRHKRLVRSWLRAPSRAEELELSPAVVVRNVRAVDDARRRTARYLELRERWISVDPAIKGGEPVIAGSRVGVYSLAARIGRGESDAVLDEDLPHVPPEAREVAVRYARSNPRRGRPRRPSRTTPPAAVRGGSTRAAAA